MDFNPIYLCPYRKGKFGHGDRHKQGELHVKMKAEVGMVHLQGKEHQRLPANHQKLGEGHGTDSLPQPSIVTNPADVLISDF